MGKKFKYTLGCPSSPRKKCLDTLLHCAHLIITYSLPEDNHRQDSRHLPIRLTVYLIIVLYLIRCPTILPHYRETQCA